MAFSFKASNGTEIKVRRLKWKEYKEHQKKQKELLDANLDNTELVEETVRKVIVEPKASKSLIEELDIEDIMKIYTFAVGGPAEDLKN